MINYLRLIVTCSFCMLVIACSNNSSKDKPNAEDSIDTTAEDSVTVARQNPPAEEDCNNSFFSGLPFMDDSLTAKLHLKNGHKVTWSQFMKDELISNRVKKGMKSIDNDSIPELVVMNNTGGAHCCEEIYIFTKRGKDFEQKAKLYGGVICIDPQTNIFTFSFNETLGYFFSCYACIYRDSSAEYRPLREMELRFYDGNFAVVPYNADVEKQVETNLRLLKDHGYMELDSGLMDNGWRKEYAMNLAVWHFNHGKNWDATQKLFALYYPFKDASKVWAEFNKALKAAERENSF
jgi:hypothetical protein